MPFEVGGITRDPYPKAAKFLSNAFNRNGDRSAYRHHLATWLSEENCIKNSSWLDNRINV